MEMVRDGLEKLYTEEEYFLWKNKLLISMIFIMEK